jgi:hypothetical protein
MVETCKETEDFIHLLKLITLNEILDFVYY